MIIYIILAILAILLCVSIYVIYNLLSQINQLEKQNDLYEDEFNKYYYAILKLLTTAKSEMDKIDYRGSFQADDEVGITFKLLQAAIDTVAEKLQDAYEENTGEKGTQKQ